MHNLNSFSTNFLTSSYTLCKCVLWRKRLIGLTVGVMGSKVCRSKVTVKVIFNQIWCCCDTGGGFFSTAQLNLSRFVIFHILHPLPYLNPYLNLSITYLFIKLSTFILTLNITKNTNNIQQPCMFVRLYPMISHITGCSQIVNLSTC